MAAAGLLLAATACSSAGDAATPGTTVAPTGTVAPSSSVPSSTSVPPTSSAPPTTSETGAARQALLSGVLESHHTAGEFVGARIALLDRDGTITEVAAGTPTVDPASGPVDPDVAWNIGSATKIFVAVVALQLAEEGRIDLDAGIDGYLPDLPGADRITPRQLLQHTSGLGEYLDQPAVQTDTQREWTPSELIAVAEAAGRVGEPGGPYHYSNTNYVVLGEIIEQATGHSWDDEVRTQDRRATGPDPHRARSPTSGPPATSSSTVPSSTRPGGRHPSIGGAAGALQSTGRDLLLFAAALADGTLLSPDSRTAMAAFVPGEDYSQFGIVHGYGLGLEQYGYKAITVHGHLGSAAAYSAFLGYDAEHGTAVAVMMNSNNPGPQVFMALETLTDVSQAS